MPCALLVDGSRHGGRVLNLSATGLFVRTRAVADVGAPVTLFMTPPDGDRACRVLARVARMEAAVDAGAEVDGGVGIDIEEAPERYYGILSQAMPPATPDGRTASGAPSPGEESAEGSGEAMPRFRVRIVRSVQSWQTRTVLLSAASEGEACRMAIAAAGAGWRVDFCEAG